MRGGSDPLRPAPLRPNPFPPPPAGVGRPLPARGSELVAQVDADGVQLRILIAVWEIAGSVILLGTEIIVPILCADHEFVRQRVIDAGTHGPADIRACVGECRAGCLRAFDAGEGDAAYAVDQ